MGLSNLSIHAPCITSMIHFKHSTQDSKLKTFKIKQVSLFCLAIGQDPKELPVAIVNYENHGMACHDQMYNLECPMTLGNLGIPEPNEHLVVCFL